MGYRDIKLALSTSQNVTADADCEYYIDTEETIPGWEKGMPAAVIINVETVNTADTGINFKVVHKAAGAPTTADANLVVASALAADLTAGKEIIIPLPRGIALLRYVALYYDVVGGSEDYILSAYFTGLP
jgi:Bbp16